MRLMRSVRVMRLVGFLPTLTRLVMRTGRRASKGEQEGKQEANCTHHGHPIITAAPSLAATVLSNANDQVT